jgi:hypothetical protein
VDKILAVSEQIHHFQNIHVEQPQGQTKRLSRFWKRTRSSGSSLAVGSSTMMSRGILSTHIVSDVSDLCRNMALIHQGRVHAAGDPGALVDALSGRVWKKAISRAEVPDYQQRRSCESPWRASCLHLYTLAGARRRTMPEEFENGPTPGRCRSSTHACTNPVI